MSEAIRALMLYDGLCGICNGAVQFVIRHDTRDRFRFAPQQSGLAATVLTRHGIDQAAMLAGNSAYLVLEQGSTQERVVGESDVLVNILLQLGGGWRILGRMLQAVPAFLRNGAYRLFARNRYRLGSQYTVCPVPTERDRLKFVG